MDKLRYINPQTYFRALKKRWVGLNLKYNKQYVCASQALDESILFHVDSWAEYSMRVNGSYDGEPTTVFWIEHSVGHDDCVYDIGANVGAYSLLIGKRMKSGLGNGLVYAFEPAAGNFYKLNANIHLNQLSQHILPFCTAIGRTTGPCEFFLSSLELGAACHGLSQAFSDGTPFPATHKQGAFAITLDDLAKQEGIRFPNHIKIDVDGLELDILQSAHHILCSPHLKSLIIEINETVSRNRCENLIQSYGLRELRRDRREGKDQTISQILYVKE